MVSDPKALAYAFIDSYLQFRAKGKWVKDIKLDEITPENYESKITDPEIRQKVECCIDTVRFISQAINEEEYFGLVYFFADEEKKQLNAANEKKNKLLPLFRWMVSSDPMIAQLERALRDIFLEYLAQTSALKAKTEKLNAELKYNKELNKLKATPENERDIENLEKQIELLTQHNFHKKFYAEHIKNSDIARELKEDSWIKFDTNIANNVRKSSFCERINAYFPKASQPIVIAPKSFVQAVAEDPVKKVEVKPPIEVSPQLSSTAAIAQNIPIKVNLKRQNELADKVEAESAKKAKEEAPIANTRPRRKTRYKKIDPAYDYPSYRR